MINYLKQNKILLVYIPLVLYWIILFIATSIPADKMPSVGVGDKFNHFFAYLVLSSFIYIAYCIQDKFPSLRKYPEFFSIMTASLYGVFDELHQMLIPGRSAEFLDWVADFIGSVTGVLIIRLLISRRSEKSGS